MRRFQGEKLNSGKRIAVISNDALGNFVVVTPLLQMLRDHFEPKEIDYYGGVRTWELQTASNLFEWSFPFHGSAPSEQADVAKRRGGYDLVVNVERSREAKIFAGRLCTDASFVCGPCSDMPGSDLPFAGDLQGKLWLDPDWTAEDLAERYPFLQTGFIGEILCRLAYLEGPVPDYKVPCETPSIPVPPVLISTAATLPEKLWPVEKWEQTVRVLVGLGHEVGLLGAHPIQQRQYWKGDEAEAELLRTGLLVDLRGKLTLPEVVGALLQAKLVVTLDNGILHLSVAAKKKTIGIFRHGIHRLWAPRSDYLTVITPDVGKQVEDLPFEAVRDAVMRAI